MFRRLTASTVLIAFVATSIVSPSRASAAPLLGLPEPGKMVALSSVYAPAMIKGITLDSKNPFIFDFIIDAGDDTSVILSEAKDPNASKLKAESIKLIKYFLAALTVPEKDLWVNLSPYEKDRMLPQNLAQTEMGRDMLAQDYLLKQITASLIYPEKELGKNFWDKVYAKAQQMYGSTEIPVNTFNKVWIVADKADVFERGQTAFVMAAHLKVMLEEDYLALDKNKTIVIVSPKGETISKGTTSTIASQIIRDIVIPELEKEVNEGKNFAPLRQMFHSMILATWFKKALKQAVVSQLYADQSKVKTLSSPNVLVGDPNKTEVQAIYDRYLQAYKKGVFNYIKEDIMSSPNASVGDPDKTTPRKYFSGGVQAMVANAMVVHQGPAAARTTSEALGKDVLFQAKAMVTTPAMATESPAMNSGESMDLLRQQLRDLLGYKDGQIFVKQEYERIGVGYDFNPSNFRDVTVRALAALNTKGEKRVVARVYSNFLHSLLNILVTGRFRENGQGDLVFYVNTEEERIRFSEIFLALNHIAGEIEDNGHIGPRPVDDGQSDAMTTTVTTITYRDVLRPRDVMTGQTAALKTVPAQVQQLYTEILQHAANGNKKRSSQEKAEFDIYVRQRADVALRMMKWVEGVYGTLMGETPVGQGDALTGGYHNATHNYNVLFADLLLANQAGLIQTVQDLDAAFFAALHHDFHVRTIMTSDGKRRTAALVEETMNQLDDLLEIKTYTQAVEGSDATYKEKLADNEEMKKSYYQLMLEFLSIDTKRHLQQLDAHLAMHIETSRVEATGQTEQLGKDATKSINDAYEEARDIFMVQVKTMIYRTDFPSNVVPLPGDFMKYKSQVEEARIKYEHELNDLLDNKQKLSTTQLAEMIQILNQALDDINVQINATPDPEGKLNDLKVTAINWVNRNRIIEVNYLEALKKVSLDRRLKIHQMAQVLEVADQSVALWLAGSELTTRITEGLRGEVPIVSVLGNYLFFYAQQILKPGVLRILSALSTTDLRRLVENIDYFAYYPVYYFDTIEQIKAGGEAYIQTVVKTFSKKEDNARQDAIAAVKAKAAADNTTIEVAATKILAYFESIKLLAMLKDSGKHWEDKKLIVFRQLKLYKKLANDKREEKEVSKLDIKSFYQELEAFFPSASLMKGVTLDDLSYVLAVGKSEGLSGDAFLQHIQDYRAIPAVVLERSTRFLKLEQILKLLHESRRINLAPYMLKEEDKPYKDISPELKKAYLDLLESALKVGVQLKESTGAQIDNDGVLQAYSGVKLTWNGLPADRYVLQYFPTEVQPMGGGVGVIVRIYDPGDLVKGKKAKKPSFSVNLIAESTFNLRLEKLREERVADELESQKRSVLVTRRFDKAYAEFVKSITSGAKFAFSEPRSTPAMATPEIGQELTPTEIKALGRSVRTLLASPLVSELQDNGLNIATFAHWKEYGEGNFYVEIEGRNYGANGQTQKRMFYVGDAVAKEAIRKGLIAQVGVSKAGGKYVLKGTDPERVAQGVNQFIADLNLVISTLRAQQVIPEAATGVSSAQASATLKPDNATVARGGIDFDANKMNMKVAKEGAGVDITFDPAMVAKMKRDGFDGFIPVIINITPMPSILPLLGLAPRKEDEEEKLAGV